MSMEYTFCMVKVYSKWAQFRQSKQITKYTKSIQCKVYKKYTIAYDNCCHQKVYFLYTISLMSHFVYFLYTNSTLKLRQVLFHIWIFSP